MSTVTRFAPSPTGFLHIGSARTALFNYLYAKANQGSYLVRIEDTDKQRSSQEAIDAILDGLTWLGLESDVEVYYQSAHASRHAEIAHQLLLSNKAYRCYATKEELASMRLEAETKGKQYRYNGLWRDRKEDDAPKDVAPTIRIKAPTTGSITIYDRIQGNVTVQCDELDDMVILRSDGSPTYMLAVVVDDHDMGVTDVIRGDDHFTNGFRQQVLYDLLDWPSPSWAHIPLIHGEDGKKLSKRHGAIGIHAYQEMGILPEAMCNYLLRLGWSHGDDEIITMKQAIEWFNLDNIGKSPARFDIKKLYFLNGHYLKQKDPERLIQSIENTLKEHQEMTLNETHKMWLKQGLKSLTDRAKTLEELQHMAMIYTHYHGLELTDKAKKSLDQQGKEIIKNIANEISTISDWNDENLQQTIEHFCQQNQHTFGQVATPIRAALTKSHMSPSIVEIMRILGKNEVLRRLHEQC